jgi:hypothetical protein
VNVGERDDNALVGGDVYPGNTSHLILHAPQGLWPWGHPYLDAKNTRHEQDRCLNSKSPVGTPHTGSACRTGLERVE